MPPPDSSTIDNALIGTLLADATLMALVPDGIWKDEAAEGKKRFVIVSLVDETDVAQYGTTGKRRAYEDTVFLIKAVMLSTSGGNISAAAARIDVVLEDAVLTVSGYQTMALHRIKRESFTEVDDVDRSIRWQHRGGQYRVQMSVT